MLINLVTGSVGRIPAEAQPVFNQPQRGLLMKKLLMFIVLAAVGIFFIPTTESSILTMVSDKSEAVMVTKAETLEPASLIMASGLAMVFIGVFSLFRRQTRPEGVFALKTKLKNLLTPVGGKDEVGWQGSPTH